MTDRRQLRTARLAARADDGEWRGHLDEWTYDDGESDGALVLAPHGGDVEPHTAEAALATVQRVPGVVGWARLGYHVDGAFDAWHDHSASIDPDDHHLLPRVADRTFDAAVSVHGYATHECLVGGGAPEDVRIRVADALDDALDAPVTVVGPDHRVGGAGPSNVVNRFTADGGVQVEVGRESRRERRAALVDGLVTAVRAL